MTVHYPNFKVNTDSYFSMLEFLKDIGDTNFSLMDDLEDDSWVLEEFLTYLETNYPKRFTLFRLDPEDKYLYVVDKETE